jgi:predicted DNA-binding antitoxin AbrB/MazE fold protein
MLQNIEAIFDQGVLKPVEPLALPQGARVNLRIEQAEPAGANPPDQSGGEIPTLLERLKGFVGTVHDLPPDASVNLDHYLYGTPKRQ